MGMFGGDKKPAAPLQREVGAPANPARSLLGDLAPTDTGETRSNASMAAIAAGNRAKKRAASGGGFMGLMTGALGATSPKAVLKPKTLTGAVKSLVGY